jgi:flagellar protein FliS
MKLHPYARAYQQNSVQTATPGQLILMLFDGALRFMKAALAGFEFDDAIQRNETIHINLVKTQAIFDELQSSLDLTVGGEFAQTMLRLYDYLKDQVRLGNMRKDSAPIHIAIELVNDLRNSWATMLEDRDKASEPLSQVKAAA